MLACYNIYFSTVCLKIGIENVFSVVVVAHVAFPRCQWSSVISVANIALGNDGLIVHVIADGGFLIITLY
jgi:hypothetical protein